MSIVLATITDYGEEKLILGTDMLCMTYFCLTNSHLGGFKVAIPAKVFEREVLSKYDITPKEFCQSRVYLKQNDETKEIDKAIVVLPNSSVFTIGVMEI